jgi:hypothetical protein
MVSIAGIMGGIPPIPALCRFLSGNISHHFYTLERKNTTGHFHSIDFF